MEKEAYIYTYVNRITKKTYIGSRSGYNTTAEEDFDIKYKSSSKNTEFLSDMKNGLLDGFIVLKIKCKNASIKIVQIEHKMIDAYWNKYGKENSYNRYCNGKFSMAGHTHSDETKENWSLKRRGENNPAYGKHLSEERKAHLRTFCGEKSSMYGKHLSEESREKLSKALKNREFSEETRKKISIANTCKIHSDETKQKISNTLKGRKFSDETLEKMKNSAHRGETHYLYGKHLSESHKLSLSKSLTGRTHTNETKTLISNKLKGKTRKLYLYQDENQNEHVMDRANKNKWHPSWIEIKEINDDVIGVVEFQPDDCVRNPIIPHLLEKLKEIE